MTATQLPSVDNTKSTTLVMTDSLPHWAECLLARHKYHQERIAVAREFSDLASADLHAAISEEIIDILEELGQVVR
jgi:hypothetical protein